MIFETRTIAIQQPHERFSGTGIPLGSTCAGILAGAGGSLAPGFCAYWWLANASPLEELTVTAPVVFAIAIIVLAVTSRWVRTLSQFLLLSAVVIGLSYAFCAVAVRLGALLAREMAAVMTASHAEAGLFGNLHPGISFTSLLATHYASCGSRFLALAAAIGIAVGLLWSRLLQAEESVSD